MCSTQLGFSNSNSQRVRRAVLSKKMYYIYCNITVCCIASILLLPPPPIFGTWFAHKSEIIFNTDAITATFTCFLLLVLFTLFLQSEITAMFSLKVYDPRHCCNADEIPRAFLIHGKKNSNKRKQILIMLMQDFWLSFVTSACLNKVFLPFTWWQKGFIQDFQKMIMMMMMIICCVLEIT